MAKKQNGRVSPPEPRRTYVSQADVPIFSLEDSLRVARALVDNYNGQPATPLQVASALDMTPTSGSFRNLCGSSIAYGLTGGGYNAQQIVLEPIGRKILKPTAEDEDVIARREAVLRPRVLGEFLRKYSGGSLPRQDIALNVLQDLGVPHDRAEAVHQLILESAQGVGFIREIKGKSFVDLSGVAVSARGEERSTEDDDQQESRIERQPSAHASGPTNSHSPPAPASARQDARRVFVTHGKNKSFIDPIKRLLGFGEMTPVVSVERQSVSKPVSDKVLDDLRSCGAAIIHVDEELRLVDKEAHEHVVINPNVLIEIGAAMALFGRRFILLVKKGLTLPSNLQGLYEVRYDGDTLDGDATIRLLEAINDIKNNPLPNRDGGKPIDHGTEPS
jgi:predicted nucleotide-binding protein